MLLKLIFALDHHGVYSRFEISWQVEFPDVCFCQRQVRFLTVTERQMEKMLVYQGHNKIGPEPIPEQLLLL